MAGSMYDRLYTDDQGKTWGVRIDEDKGGLVAAGFQPVPADSNVDYLPRGFKMRGVRVVKTSGDGAGYINAFIPCGTLTAALFAGTTKTVTWNGNTWAVTSTKGEVKRKPKAANTGLVGANPTVGTGGGGGTTQ